jgi:isopentenyl-diphosphate Delta-isomerase
MTKKKDHIDLALKSQTNLLIHDNRFNYEPLLSPHPAGNQEPFDFAGKKMKAPIWISSMTGGSESSLTINTNLARACNEFGLGMGLGSCRILLEDGEYFDHFNLRGIIGADYPFYANLGICQVEKYLLKKESGRIVEMVNKLQADGLIIHVNPLQEWLQPEGERITMPPVVTIREFLAETNLRLIIKEVGQGFGPASIRELLKLPVEAIETAAYGGTNFAKVELQRSSTARHDLLEPLTLVGNDAYQIIDEINKNLNDPGVEVKCRYIIVSGGLKNFLDGYYFIEKCGLKSVYGQASAFLKHAKEDYSKLKEFIESQIEGLKISSAYLRIKD